MKQFAGTGPMSSLIQSCPLSVDSDEMRRGGSMPPFFYKEGEPACRAASPALRGILVAAILMIPITSYAGIRETKATIRRVAIEEKIKPEHLLAMAFVESRYNPQAVGDNSKSIGILQIQYKLHGLKRESCFNVEFSARWACQYLIRMGYKKNCRLAIKKYNGRGKKAENYLERVLNVSRNYL